MGAWLSLVVLDVVTVATFARCFDGPGELAKAIPLCIVAHLIGHGARSLHRRSHRAASIATWVLAVLLVGFLPLALVDGGTFHWFVPMGGTRHALGSQIGAAWHIFSSRIAPVSQAPGLVLAISWAAGLVGLAAEALDGDTSMPAIVALVPAFDIVMFTGTLGTPVGRAPELAALAALAVFYLAATSARSPREQVVTARVEGSAGNVSAISSPTGPLRQRLFNTPVPGLVAVAALTAGIIGPYAPGARTGAVISWHNSQSSPDNFGGPPGAASGLINVSDVVSLQEVEVRDADVNLLEVRTKFPTREIMTVLDGFNGSNFYQVNSGPRTGFPVEPPDYVNSLPAIDEYGHTAIVSQTITDLDLGGSTLPIPGLPLDAIAGPAAVTVGGSDGTVAVGPLRPKSKYWVEGTLYPSPAVAQSYVGSGAPTAPTLSADTYLPAGQPANIVNLAHELAGDGQSEAEVAARIVQWLQQNDQYYLPTSPVSESSKPYAALENFLFQDRRGYCQQFASAFAVLARMDGIATRVVVGFLPGSNVNGDNYIITGADYHSWPQVFFPGTGWVDVEPTPGAGLPPYPTIAQSPPSTTVTPSSTVVGPTVANHGTPPKCRSCIPPGGHSESSSSVPLPTIVRTPRSALGPGSAGVGDTLLVLLALLLLYLVAIPTLRRLRYLRRGDPRAALALSWTTAAGWLAAAGLHRRRYETLVEFATRVHRAGLLTDEADLALARLVATANSAAFSVRPPSQDDAARAAADARLVRQSAQRSVSWWLRFAIEMDPRDLLGIPV